MIKEKQFSEREKDIKKGKLCHMKTQTSKIETGPSRKLQHFRKFGVKGNTREKENKAIKGRGVAKTSDIGH